MSQEETDYAWLDKLIRDIYYLGEANENLVQHGARTREEYFAARDSHILAAKAEFQARFTAHAKQHQVELIRARIDELHIEANVNRLAEYKGLPPSFQKRMNKLQAELDKLENKQ